FRDKLNPDKINIRQKKVMRNMVACRTPQMGAHVAFCNHCGKEHVFYKSCRDRHCTRCGGLKRDVWVAKRKADALPVDYFHIVFTIPESLNRLCLFKPEIMYNILFKSAWDTISHFASKHRHLGVKTGMAAILHTWGQTLALHPHIHCLVPGGGITPQGKWKNARPNGKYLFPVKAMSKVFRGKFTDELYKLQEEKIISLDTPIDPTKKYLHPLYKTKWVVYAKNPVNGGEQVIEYIGKYSHRVAISNSRIKDISDDKVTFSWFDYRKSVQDIMQLDGEEFLRRFLLHVLPSGFVKIRHYGILSCRNKEKNIALVHNFYDSKRPTSLKGLNWKELFMLLYGRSPFLCPYCKKGELVIKEILPPMRSPPLHLLVRQNEPVYAVI
ncbi:MAG: IS91 family transposase, partial [Bacteroidia bacterium]|nr:IS91 family transposase [Bacteroidia bacterium]